MVDPKLSLGPSQAADPSAGGAAATVDAGRRGPGSASCQEGNPHDADYQERLDSGSSESGRPGTLAACVHVRACVAGVNLNPP
jgi:hypothetical protein